MKFLDEATVKSLSELMAYSTKHGYMREVPGALVRKLQLADRKSNIAREKGGGHHAAASDAHDAVADELETHGFKHLANKSRDAARKHTPKIPSNITASVESLIREGTALLETT